MTRTAPWLLLLTALGAACGGPPQATATATATAERSRAAAEKYDLRSKDDVAAQQQAELEFKTRVEDPGSISREASDELIAQLEWPDPQSRARAAIGLANANGKRAVEPIIKALRSESDEKTYVTFIVALDTLSDMRAVNAFVEALRQPGIPDKSREHALRSILRFRAGGRFVPQIRAFYDSLTDPEIRKHVEPVVLELEK
jgi:HEAT repeat protein